MISPAAAIVRAVLRIYTYPYRKKFASISRSVKLKNSAYRSPRGFDFGVESYGGVQVEKLAPQCCSGALIMFHGGGHTVGMNDMYRRAAEILGGACGRAVYSINYTAAHGLTFPSVHDECYRAYSALASCLQGTNFVAAGDSFGANLLLGCCLRAMEEGVALPRAVVCVCPYADMSASGDSYRTNCYNDPLYGLLRRYKFEEYGGRLRRISPYCGDTPLKCPQLSPVYANFSGFPKTLIICGGYETSLSDGKMLHAAMLRDGCSANLHIYEGMWHDFMYMFPRLKESRAAWREISQFLSAKN